MRIIVRPVADPQQEIDLTEKLVSAIAAELWRLYGGNDQLNWLEAEAHLKRIVGEARCEARETRLVMVPTEGSGSIPEACPGCPRRTRQVRVTRTGLGITRGRRPIEVSMCL